MVTLKTSLYPRLDIKKNRTNSISPEQEKKMKEKGCINIYWTEVDPMQAGMIEKYFFSNNKKHK
jgi:hypothetical protein